MWTTFNIIFIHHSQNAVEQVVFIDLSKPQVEDTLIYHPKKKKNYYDGMLWLVITDNKDNFKGDSILF